MTEPSRSAVVAFAGHMIDRRGAPEPRFPPHREPAIGAAIRQRLGSLSAGISYSAAANGSDILFVEAMLERGAEVNLVLPFPAADFVKTSVAAAGRQWVRRFERAVAAASSVRCLARQARAHNRGLYEACNRAIVESARRRAVAAGVACHLLVVWDGVSAGGTAHCVSIWPEPSTLHRIPVAAQKGISDLWMIEERC